MPTVFSHAIFATALGAGYARGRKMPKRFWLLTPLVAMLPDADVIGRSFGVARDSVLSHRGLTHSILFACFVGLIVAWSFFRGEITRHKYSLAAFFALATFSHPLLDMLTDGGSGVALFAPFSNARFFFPVRPIEVSPISLERFFSPRGLEVVFSEMLWVWLPSVIIVLVAWLLGRSKRRAAVKI